MVHELIFCSEGRTIPWVRYAFLLGSSPLRPKGHLLTLFSLRVPGHDHAAIGFALDAGASIVIPQVETVAQAQHVVSAAKFGTKSRGTRSAPPFRLIPGVTDGSHDPNMTLYQNLNEQAGIMLQIETLQGIRNLDAILTEVPDIDCVWLGTLDTRISMNMAGNGGMGGPEPEWLEAVELFDQTLAKHGKARAGFAFGDEAASRKTGQHNVLNVVAADVIALMGMSELQANARKWFPAEEKRVPLAKAVEKMVEEPGKEEEKAEGESFKPLVVN